jgi:hypothetical protein
MNEELNATLATRARQPITVPATDSHPSFEIDPEFEKLLPRPTPEETAGLAAMIQKGKHVDDLVTFVFDGHRILGDGHNRRRICDEKGIPYSTRDVEVGSREEAIEWIINNQLSKRNLTDEQRDYFIGKFYLANKQKAGGDRKSKSAAQNEHMIGAVAEAIAEQHGVSPATVRRDAEFAEAVDAIANDEGPEAKEEILRGKSGRTKAEIISRRPRKKKGSKPTRKSVVPPPGFDDKPLQDVVNKLLLMIAARGRAIGKGEGFDRCMAAAKDLKDALKIWQKEGQPGTTRCTGTRPTRTCKQRESAPPAMHGPVICTGSAVVSNSAVCAVNSERRVTMAVPKPRLPSMNVFRGRVNGRVLLSAAHSASSCVARETTMCLVPPLILVLNRTWAAWRMRPCGTQSRRSTSAATETR